MQHTPPQLDATTRAALEQQYRELKSSQAQIGAALACVERLLGKPEGTRTERRTVQRATDPHKTLDAS